jgi:predicted ATP-dependent serine protease
MTKQVQPQHDLVQINKVSYDPNLFDSHMTGTHIDKIFSIKGGIPKATNWMVVGDPGVGKSTVTMSAISNAKKNGSKVLFISAEMSRVDMYLYVERYPQFGELDILFTGEHIDSNPKKLIEEILDRGYDIVLVDSFVEVQDDVKEACRMSTGQAEKWLLDLMYRHNLGQNKEKRYTTFLNIQQVNKGGNFVGSNKLKHMTTGMMEIRFEDPENVEAGRFIFFSKNRRGHVGKKLYFDLSKSGDVQYDWERFQKAEKMEEMRKVEKEKLKEEGEVFDKLFGVGEKEKTVEQVVEELLGDSKPERINYTETQLMEMSSRDLFQMCIDRRINVPSEGANTNKKLRLLILQQQSQNAVEA